MTESSVESTLRDTLYREADGIGVLEDPWPRFARREVRHRRARRLGTLAFTTGFVVAAVLGVHAGVVPLPGRTPDVATALPPSALAEGPTRGSLAGDRAWLAAFRNRVDGFDDPQDRGWWEVADRTEIRVVYASDRPGVRLGLAFAPLRLGSRTEWHFLWYEGPRGADARQMRASGGEQSTDPSVLAFLRTTSEDGGFGIAIGPPDSTVTIVGEPHYSRSGRVEPRQLAVPDGPGVAVAVLPSSSPLPSGLLARVTRDGALVHQERLAGGAYGPVFGLPGRSTDAVLDAAVRGARGPELDRSVLTDFISTALADSCLPPTGVAVRLLWSGPVQGWTTALFTVQPTDGGVIAYVMRRRADGSGWTDMRLLLPAEGAERRPIGWRLRAEDSQTRTDTVMVVAPAGAATASVTIGRGTPVPVPLDSSKVGTVRVPLGQSATVTAYSADGSVLASTPVPPGDEDTSGLPGDTPGTRVVP